MSAIRRVRFTEPVGAMYHGKTVIVPAGTEGLVAYPWPGETGFPVIVDAWSEDDIGHEFDGARCPEIIDAQVEEIDP
jgi:hypothetical protein